MRSIADTYNWLDSVNQFNKLEMIYIDKKSLKKRYMEGVIELEGVPYSFFIALLDDVANMTGETYMSNIMMFDIFFIENEVKGLMTPSLTITKTYYIHYSKESGTTIFNGRTSLATLILFILGHFKKGNPYKNKKRKIIAVDFSGS